MGKMKYRRCRYLNYDFLDEKYEPELPPFCGLHGRTKVDPDGEQQDLNHRGGCGFSDKNKPIELKIMFV